MTRSEFKRNFTLLLFALFGGSYYAYQSGQDLFNQVVTARQSADSLQGQIDAVRVLTSSLNELDALTLDEKDLTTLDVLRHLGLEKSLLAFRALPPAEQSVGGTSLYLRRFTVSGEMPYAEALAQMDSLNSSKKVTLTHMVLEPPVAEGDMVKLQIEGVTYGLRKTL